MLKVELYDHQVDVLQKTIDECKVGYFLDMG